MISGEAEIPSSGEYGWIASEFSGSLGCRPPEPESNRRGSTKPLAQGITKLASKPTTQWEPVT